MGSVYKLIQNDCFEIICVISCNGMNKVLCILQILFSFSSSSCLLCLFKSVYSYPGNCSKLHLEIKFISKIFYENASNARAQSLQSYHLYNNTDMSWMITVPVPYQKEACWGGWVGSGGKQGVAGEEILSYNDETHGLHLPEAHLEILNSAATPSWSEKGKFCPGTWPKVTQHLSTLMSTPEMKNKKIDLPLSCVCVHVCMRVYMHVWACMCVCVCVRVQARVRVSVHTQWCCFGWLWPLS